MVRLHGGAPMTDQKRHQHSDIPAELIPQAEAQLATIVCALMGIPRDRLKTVKIFDAHIEGRTGVEFDFQPDLDTVESERLREVTKLISAATGGRPPIFPGQA